MNKLCTILLIVLLLSVSLVYAEVEEEAVEDMINANLYKTITSKNITYDKTGSCGFAKSYMYKKAGYGKIGHGAFGSGILKIVYFAFAAFLFSIIFWLTHNWLVKGKKKRK
tara:strand:- start:10624 stop:10956 length:333 start_codon:yes stop_codon:yes gene_type:complete